MVYLFWEITIGMLASSVDGHRFNIALGHTKRQKSHGSYFSARNLI